MMPPHPCPWQCPDLLPRVTMMPFSVEKASEGNPWMFQSRTLVGLDRKLSKVKRGEHGTCSSQIWVGKSPEFQPGDLSLSSPQT